MQYLQVFFCLSENIALPSLKSLPCFPVPSKNLSMITTLTCACFFLPRLTGRRGIHLAAPFLRCQWNQRCSLALTTDATILPYLNMSSTSEPTLQCVSPSITLFGFSKHTCGSSFQCSFLRIRVKLFHPGALCWPSWLALWLNLTSVEKTHSVVLPSHIAWDFLCVVSPFVSSTNLFLQLLTVHMDYLL